MANKGQTSIITVDVSRTMTGSPVQVCKQDMSRGLLLLQNNAIHTIFFVFAPGNNNNVAPTITPGAAGVFALVGGPVLGTPGGSYEPDGGGIPCNEIWASGTNGDVLTACVSAPTP